MALRTPNGCFYVRNRYNGLVLQLDSATNSVCLKAQGEISSDDQLWYRDGNFIKSKLNNLALTMNPGMAAVGARLYAACCQWSPYQKWITKSNSQIANFMEQCLVLQTDENSNVKVKLENVKDDAKQLWDFVPVRAGEPATGEAGKVRLVSMCTEI